MSEQQPDSVDHDGTTDDQHSAVTVEDAPADPDPTPPDDDGGGPGLFGMMVLGFWQLFLKLLWPIKVIPKTSAIADMVIVGGYQLKKATSGCDAVVNQVYGDRMVIPRAGWYDAEEEGYVTKNGDVAKVEGEGIAPYSLHGKVPVVWTLKATKEAFDPVAAAAARQRDIGRWIEQKREGDTDVFLGVRPGKDIVLNFERVWEMYMQQIDDEDLQTQYDLGYIAGMEGQNRLWLIVLVSFVAGMILTGALIFVFLKFGGSGGGAGIVSVVAPIAGVM